MLAFFLGLALILSLCGTKAGAFAGKVENGNTNTSNPSEETGDLREGTSADNVPPGGFSGETQLRFGQN